MSRSQYDGTHVGPHNASPRAVASPAGDATSTGKTHDFGRIADARAALDALDMDRSTVAGRLASHSPMPTLALLALTALANAVMYWLVGWTLLGGHGAFTIVDLGLMVIVALLLIAAYVIVLSHTQRITGIGVWNGRLFAPEGRMMRHAPFRSAFLIYTACSVGMPIVTLLVGATCAPWWPIVICAPLCVAAIVITYRGYYRQLVQLSRATPGMESERHHGE